MKFGGQMDLDLSLEKQDGRPTLEIKSSLSYSGANVSGDMELFIFIPQTLKIKTWSKNDIFSDFSCRLSLPSISVDEVNSANVLYEISLLQRLLDEVRIQNLKNLPFMDIKNEILTQARHLAALMEEFFKLSLQKSEVDLIVQIIQKILRHEDVLQLSGIRELDQHIEDLARTQESTPAGFVQKQSEMQVDVYSKKPHLPIAVAFGERIMRSFRPDRIRILNERNKEFGTFEDWFRVLDSGQIPSRITRSIMFQEKHDVLYFKRKFNLKSYLKADYPCGLKEVLKFNLQKVVHPQVSEIYAYAQISLDQKQKSFFRRQESEFTAKVYKITVSLDGIGNIEQLN